MSGATFPVDPKEYPGPVDIVLSMNTKTSAKDTSNTVEDSYGNVVQTSFTRTVTIDVTYQVVRARDLSPIGQGTKSASAEDDNYESQSKLSSASDIAAQIFNKPLEEVVGEMIPTQRSLTITLEKEKSDKQAKKAMGDADKLVKAKDYKAAAEAYGRVYAQHKNFAAGYNQAVLTEAADGVEPAVKLMEALAKASGNATAQSALTGMRQRLAANQKAAEQLSE
jgi:hypothetical protein